MTPFLLTRQNTVRHYFNTSTTRTPHPVNSGTHTTRLTSFSGHPSHHWTQHLLHYSLQEAHTYRSISPLGQQPSHHSQTKCLQYSSSQGQGGFFPRQTGPGTMTHQSSTTSMPVPQLGPQPVAPQIPKQQPSQQQQPHHQPGQQPHQKEHYSSGPLHPRDKWKIQKNCARPKEYKYTTRAPTLSGHC